MTTAGLNVKFIVRTTTFWRGTPSSSKSTTSEKCGVQYNEGNYLDGIIEFFLLVKRGSSRTRILQRMVQIQDQIVQVAKVFQQERVVLTSPHEFIRCQRDNLLHCLRLRYRTLAKRTASLLLIPTDVLAVQLWSRVSQLLRSTAGHDTRGEYTFLWKSVIIASWRCANMQHCLDELISGAQNEKLVECRLPAYLVYSHTHHERQQD